MQLTIDNVTDVLKNCLYDDIDGDTSDAIVVRGITTSFGFDPKKVDTQKDNISSMLAQLPDSFHVGKGAGHSFLNACMHQDGSQWGEHRQMEALFCLGIAIDQVIECLPRELWPAMLGGMPYYQVNTGE